MFSVLEEYTTWFKERFEFVLVELNQLSVMERAGDDSFFRSLADRQELISRIVKRAFELEKGIGFRQRLSWDCLESMSEIEKSYYVLPGLLNDTLQSFLNRRGREYISRYAPKRLKGAIVSLSSVHPTYAVSILSLECLSNALHYKLKPIFGDKFEHLTPLTRLWESFEYSTKLLDYIEPILEPTKGNGHGIKVGNLLYLSGINLPRWAPHHIRVAGSILAHEHFHHVIYLVKLCLKSRAQGKFNGRRIEDVFGSLLLEMSQAFTDLLSKVDEFLPTQTQYKHDPWLTHRIWRITEELLCDVAGFVLVGPAFSYALTLQVLPSIFRDNDYLNMFHPLPNVRIALQIELLKHFNFPASTKRLEKFSQPIMEFVQSQEYRKCLPGWLAKELEYNKSGGKSTAHFLQLGWREWLSKYQLTHFLDKMEG